VISIVESIGAKTSKNQWLNLEIPGSYISQPSILFIIVQVVVIFRHILVVIYTGQGIVLGVSNTNI
jgi:hypothetical protein